MNISDDPIIPPKAVARRLGVSVVTLWRWRRDGKTAFPAPIHLSNGRIAWRSSALEAWLDSRVLSA